MADEKMHKDVTRRETGAPSSLDPKSTETTKSPMLLQAERAEADRAGRTETSKRISQALFELEITRQFSRAPTFADFGEPDAALGTDLELLKLALARRLRERRGEVRKFALTKHESPGRTVSNPPFAARDIASPDASARVQSTQTAELDEEAVDQLWARVAAVWGQNAALTRELDADLIKLTRELEGE